MFAALLRIWSNYVKAFIENDITLDILGDLDHNILQETGMKSGGYRLRIIKYRKKKKII